MDELKALSRKALEEVEQASSLAGLEDVRISYLGKKGPLVEQMRKLRSMDPEERKSVGQIVNTIKGELQAAIDAQKNRLETALIAAQIQEETVDVTLPIRPRVTGSIHPISFVIEEVIAILGDLGFILAEGPEIEDDFHNFTALNIPANHPAREMQDTFYIRDTEHVLRTHTSSVQIRTMEKGGTPPYAIMAPGRVYRSDYDMTHTPMFHQVEGLYIDESINMGHLKGCIEAFLQRFFELSTVPLRFRTSFFPFTEPSAEVDIAYGKDSGNIKIGSGDEWLEILGCGMVHPNVLKNVGIDPSAYQGFAFGIGIERLAMLKYGIPDLRHFFDSDIRWLEHFNFNLLDVPSKGTVAS